MNPLVAGRSPIDTSHSNIKHRQRLVNQQSISTPHHVNKLSNVSRNTKSLAVMAGYLASCSPASGAFIRGASLVPVPTADHPHRLDIRSPNMNTVLGKSPFSAQSHQFNVAHCVAGAPLMAVQDDQVGHDKKLDSHLPENQLPEGVRDPRGSMIYKFYKLLNQFQPKMGSVDKGLAFRGNFAPVAEEHRAVPLKVVEGEIPADLDGLYFRNGPNPIPNHQSKPSHWFDGHGMLHCVRIKNAEATYSNTYIPTPRYQIEKAAGEDLFVKMGEFEGGVPALIKAMIIEKGLAKAAGLEPYELFTGNNNAVMFRDKFYCLHEAGYPFEVQLADDGAIEKALGYETFHGGLKLAAAGHSVVDPANGNFLIHSYMHDGPLATAEVSSDTGIVGQKLGGPVAKKSLVPSHVSVSHEIVFSEKWRIIFDTPLRMDPMNMVTGGNLFRWDDSRTLRIGLIPRDSNREVSSEDEVVWIDTGVKDAVFHTMNAWDEESGAVVFWALMSQRFEPNFNGKGSSELNEPFHMVEYRIDPTTGSATRTLIDDQLGLESPTCRSDQAGRFCRFGFAGLTSKDPALEGVFTGFTVWDLQDKKHLSTIPYKQGEVSSEPILIPKSGKSGSKEVYVGAYIHNLDEDQSYFLLYDGESESSKPVARLQIPFRVPYGFHGSWIEGDALSRHVSGQQD